MNKLTTLVIFTFFLFFSSSSFAQISKCCSNVVAPEVTNSTGSAIAVNSTTTAPTLAVSAFGLANTEYIITKRGVLAGSTPDGDIIVGISANGIFIPANQSRTGVSLTVGDVMDITAVGYDLAQQQNLIGSILNNMTNGQPCCSLLEYVADAQKFQDPTFTSTDSLELVHLCDTLYNNGINIASNVTSFNEVLFVVERFSSNKTSSIESLIDGIALVNSYGSYISPDCGGTSSNNFFKHGINPIKRAGTPLSIATSVVERLSPVSNFIIMPNPAQGQATLMISSQETTNLSINVFNTLGEQVQTQQANAILGNQQIQLDLSKLSPNMYFVELNDGAHKVVKKLIVQ